jgi:hypothetical protein
MTISTSMWEVIHALADQSARQIDLRPGIRTPGKVAEIWKKYLAEVEAQIKEQKLQPVQILAAREMPAMKGAAPTQENALFWWNPKGGWPLPHFHYNDNIYPATAAQWNAFSGKVLSKVGADLQKATAKVAFDEVVQIVETAH